MYGPGGMYACRAEIRFENSEGNGDDSAANGLKLTFCGLHEWRIQVVRQVYPGVWGQWKGMQMCPYGMYIGQARVRFEDADARDDSALNGLEIKCVDKDWKEEDEEETMGI